MEYSNQLIDDYLLDRLSGVELEQFEKKLKTDQSLASKVEERKIVLGVVDAFGDIEMMEQISAIHKKEVTADRKSTKFRFLYAAAAALALFVVIWFLMKPASPETLFADYYQAYDLSFTTRNDDNDQQLAQADLLYKSRNFKEALPLFEEQYKSGNTGSKIGIALGICHIEMQRYSEALPYFSNILNQEFDTYRDQALWYTALIKLKQNDVQSARPFLQELADNSKSYFYQQAKMLLSEL